MAKACTFLFVGLISMNLIMVLAQSQSYVLQLNEELDPIQQKHVADDVGVVGDGRSDREKRLLGVKKIGLTSGLLNLVFGKIDSFIDAKTRAINELDKQNVIKNQKYFGITPPPPAGTKSQAGSLKTTTLAPVKFDVNAPVSLVIPDRLYGSSFTLVTNASKIFGDVIYNTADRAQEFAERVNAKLRNKFGFTKKFIKTGDDVKG